MTSRGELGARFVACKGWRWMPGMAGEFASGEPFRLSAGPKQQGHVDVEPSCMLPDTNDGATLGCIEHGLLPEAYGCGVSVVAVPICGVVEWWAHFHDGREAELLGGENGPWPTSRAEALLAALEASPANQEAL